MPVSHARDTAVTSTDEQAAGPGPRPAGGAGQVPDPRKRRGRRFLLVFVLAVAVACALAGAGTPAKSATMPLTCQEVLKPRSAGDSVPCCTDRRLERLPVRALVHAVGADCLDAVHQQLHSGTRGAPGGASTRLLTAITIDGK